MRTCPPRRADDQGGTALVRDGARMQGNRARQVFDETANDDIHDERWQVAPGQVGDQLVSLSVDREPAIRGLFDNDGGARWCARRDAVAIDELDVGRNAVRIAQFHGLVVQRDQRRVRSRSAAPAAAANTRPDALTLAYLPVDLVVFVFQGLHVVVYGDLVRRRAWFARRRGWLVCRCGWFARRRCFVRRGWWARRRLCRRGWWDVVVALCVVVGGHVVVVGGDVVVVVTGGGEAVSWAGAIMKLTSGFDHLLGMISAVATPPTAIFRIRLRS